MNNLLSFAYTISRPRFWGYLAGPYLIGYTFGIPNQSALLTPVFFLHLVYFLTIANIFLYGVNDLFDADTDKKNPKKESHEHRLQTTERLQLKRLLLISLALSVAILAIQPDLTAVLLFLTFILLAFFYSAKPLRFKARPFIDFSSNVLYALPGFLAYYHATQTLPSVEVMVAAFCWTGAMHLFSAIPDINPDKKAGLKTTAVLLGAKPSLLLCTVLWMVFALLILRHEQLFPWSLLVFIYPAIPLYVYFHPKAIESIYWKFPYVTMILGTLLFFLIALSKPF